MSNQYLKLRRSAIPGKIPETSSIDFGEIALNTYDGLAFIKKSGSSGEEIVTIGSGTSSNISGSNNFIPIFSGSTSLVTSSIYQSGSFTSIGATSSLHPNEPETFLVNSLTDSYNLISGHATIDNYVQLNIKNFSGGVSSSSDIVATADTGDEEINYINMGINGSGYTAGNAIGGALDAYLYNTGENLYIGNTAQSKQIVFFNGGFDVNENAALFIHDQGTISINTAEYNEVNPPSLAVQAPNLTTNTLIEGVGDTDQFLQLAISNQNSGSFASSDIVAYNNLDPTNQGFGFIDMGISSTNYSDPTNYPGWQTGHSYLYTDAPGLKIGSTSGSSIINLFVGGINPNENSKLILRASNIHSMTGSLQVLGSVTGSSDFLINGVTVGRGSGGGFSNTVVGLNSFTNNTTGHTSIVLGGGGLRANTTGYRNVAIGSNVLLLNTTGLENIGISAFSLLNNNGNGNIAIGLYNTTSNISGSYNVSLGNYGNYEINGGSYNTSIGHNTGRGIVTGSYNTVLGAQVTGLASTLNNNIILADGQGNIKYRWDATQNNIYGNLAVTGSVTATTGFTGSLFGTASWAQNALTSSYVVNAISASYLSGSSAIVTNLTSSNDALINRVTVGSGGTQSAILGEGAKVSNFGVSIGYLSLANTTGTGNVSVGYYSMYSNTTGLSNVSVGANALLFNTTGKNNTAIGSAALNNLRLGDYNIGVGDAALGNLRLGDYNIAVGRLLSSGLVTGSYNTIIGSQITGLASTLNNNIILADGQGNIKYRWDGTQNTIAGGLNVTGGSITGSNAVFTGTLTAQTLVVQTITSSIDFVTGSTRFGSLLTNTHQFTGSVSVTGSLAVNESSVILSNQTGSMSVLSSSFSSTASYALNVVTSSLTGSFVTLNTTQTISGSKIFSPTVTAVSSLGIGTTFAPTLSSSANSNTLVGLELTPTFFTGSYTVGSNLAMRVRGNTVIYGGNDTYDYPLVVNNTAGTTRFSVRNDGVISVGGGLYVSSIYGTSGGVGSLLLSSNGTGTVTINGYNQNTILDFGNSGANETQTSGTCRTVLIGLNFTPTSGTAQKRYLEISPYISQSGAASGITRGIYINPSLISATDWRSIETTNNTGYALYLSGSATNYIAGNVGIGTTTPSYKLDINGTARVGGVLTVGTINGVNQHLYIGGTPSLMNTNSMTGLGNALAFFSGGTTVGQHGFVWGNTYAGISFMQLRASTGNLLINSTDDNGFRTQINGAGSLSGSLWISGSSVMSGSLTITQGITGSLLGTASFSTTSSLPLRGLITASVAGATITFTKGDSTTFDLTIAQSGTVSTASYVTSSGVYGPFGANSILSSSYSVTASYWSGSILNSTSASYAATAALAPAYVLNSATSSMLTQYVLTSVTASMLSPYVLSSNTSSFITNSQTASMSVLSASFASTASSAENFTVRGTLTAQTIVAQTITSSTDFVTGSTKFGSLLSNTHQFTGSVSITGSLTLPYLSAGSVLFTGTTDNIAEDNTNLFWDNTNKRLGIGVNTFDANTKVTILENYTAGASTGLRVKGSGTSTSIWKGRIVAGGDTVAFLMGEYNSQAWLGGHNAALNAWAPLRINPDGTTDLYLGNTSTAGSNPIITIRNSTGNVTVGSGADAAYRLDVNGTFRANGNSEVTGSLKVTQGITGSLFGTSSWANNALTSSYVLNAISSSYSATAALAPNYVLNSSTSSMLLPYVLTSVTSSMSVATSSYSVTSSLPLRGLITGSVAGSTLTFTKGDGTTFDLTVAQSGTVSTASYVTSSGVFGPYGANSIATASYALTASYVANASSFPYTGSAIITGSFTVTGSTSVQSLNIGSSQFNNTSSVTSAGTTIISQLATGSYTSCFYNYTIASASNARSGQVMSVWNGTTVRYAEVTTTDIGNTATASFAVALSGANIQLNFTAPGSWTVKNISNLL